MKRKLYLSGCALIILLGTVIASGLQTDPWSADQLMPPSELATKINSNVNPLVICVGPAGLIKGSVEAGAAHEPAGIEKLKGLLSGIDRNKEVIIYCGCCPFKNCPNVRPAFNLLLSMHFTHPRLLDLPHNVRVDWIEHGYPLKDAK
jgi:hypothetical protein